MRRYLYLFIFIFAFATTKGQIKPNEKLVFDASYNLSGMLTHIAQVTMETEQVSTSKKSYIHLSVSATTFSKWDSFFKIRDLYESYIEPSSYRPVLYKRNVLEGKYIRTEKYTFKPNGTIAATSINKRGAVKNSNFHISSSTIDVVTVVYKLRTIDFSRFRSGQTASFRVVFDEKEYGAFVKYLGKEVINCGSLGKRECYKLSVSAQTNKLKGKDQNVIWLTADEAKIPAQIKFNIPVGSGHLVLSRASGI